MQEAKMMCMKEFPTVTALRDTPEARTLNELMMAGFVIVPTEQLQKLLKDSTYLELMLDVYQQRGETYDMGPLVKSIARFYNRETIKNLRNERLKLEAARQDLEKAKAAKKEEIMELLNKLADGDGDKNE